MTWLDRIPYSMIIPLALFLAFAPFSPEPHLWQKLKMLMDGALVKPVDIFDLFMHAAPLVLLVLKLAKTSRS